MSSTLHQTIKTLQSLKGKAKQTFLEEFRDKAAPQDVEDLKQYFLQVYNGENWYQTEIKGGSSNSVLNIGKPKLTALEAISEFLKGTRRGDAGSASLSGVYSRCKDEGERELLQYALWKDMKAGFAEKSINKVFKDLIFIPPYQRLATIDKGYHLKWDWSEGVIVQNKEDWMFANMICDPSGSSELRSRNFNIIDHPDLPLVDLANFLGGMLEEKMVVHGELYVTDADDKPLGREASNGLVNGIIQTGEQLPAGHKLKFIAWDIIGYDEFMAGKCEIPYYNRLTSLEYIWCSVDSLEPKFLDVFTLENSETCHTLTEVRDAFAKVVKGRGEGIVMKNPRGIWEDHDGGHPDAIKVKVQIDSVELRIVSYNEADAKSKHAGTFASLQCESEDGKIITGVSGMTDAMRLEIHMNREKYQGGIISARCNGIQYNPEEPHSLYFAQFVEVRTDKTVADTFERIVSIQNAAIESKIMSKEK